MTHEEILQKAAKELEAGRPALTTVADALWYEREECARTAEVQCEQGYQVVGARKIAAAIRARGK